MPLIKLHLYLKKVDDKITLYKTTATADSDKLNISQLLTFNFIKDKSYDKDTLVLKAAVILTQVIKALTLTTISIQVFIGGLSIMCQSVQNQKVLLT